MKKKNSIWFFTEVSLLSVLQVPSRLIQIMPTGVMLMLDIAIFITLFTGQGVSHAKADAEHGKHHVGPVSSS